METTGPYLNLVSAAAYCGYKPDPFRRLIKASGLPKRGPKGNRYSRADLDAFMADPDAFKGAGDQHVENADKVEG